MTLADVYNMLDGITELKGKVRYRAFPIDSGDVPLPPYAVYFETDSNNFVADNKVYNAGDDVSIELYETNRDFTLEGKIETALNNLELPWVRSSRYQINDNIYEIVYSITIRR